MQNKLANRERIGNLLRNGFQHKDIAESEGCSISTVAKVAGELSLQTRRNTQYVVMPTEAWDELLAAYHNGSCTVTQLARQFSVSRSAIYKRLNVNEDD